VLGDYYQEDRKRFFHISGGSSSKSSTTTTAAEHFHCCGYTGKGPFMGSGLIKADDDIEKSGEVGSDQGAETEEEAGISGE